MNMIVIVCVLNVMFFFVNVGMSFYKVGKYVIGRVLHNKIKHKKCINVFVLFY